MGYGSNDIIDTFANSDECWFSVDHVIPAEASGLELFVRWINHCTAEARNFHIPSQSWHFGKDHIN